MEILDIRKKTEKDLKTDLKKLRNDLEKVVSDVLQKKEKNVKKVRFIKKDIAKVLTVLNERAHSVIPSEKSNE